MRTTARYGRKADIALTLWVKLARAFATFDRQSTENIRTFGLTPAQFAVFECLGHLGPMTIGALAQKRLISGGNATCIVDNLEREGLLTRRSHPDDRRVTIIGLTKKGAELFERVFPEHARWIQHLASVLTEEEQVRLAALLKKLGTRLNTGE